MILGFYVQAQGIGIPLAVPVVAALYRHHPRLVFISGNRTLTRANTPACLGQPFVPDR